MQVLKIRRWWNSFFGWRIRLERKVTNMTPQQERHFDAAFKHMDAAFSEMDKVFENFEKVFWYAPQAGERQDRNASDNASAE